MTQEKVCKKCGMSLPIEDFVKAAERPTGYRNICKQCNRVLRAEQLSKLAPDVIAERRMRHNEKDRIARESDPEKAKLQAREASAKYREKVKQQVVSGKTPKVITEKICTKCDRNLPIDEFHRLNTSPDGRKPQCKKCANNASRDYERQNRNYVASMRKKRRARYKEKERLYNQEWHKNNPGRRLELLREWQRNNRERTRELSRQRLTRQRLIQKDSGNHTDSEWIKKLAFYGGRCAHCGTQERITRDHIVPLSRGGTDLIDNIQPLCHSCNSRKHNRLESEYEHPVLVLKHGN